MNAYFTLSISANGFTAIRDGDVIVISRSSNDLLKFFNEIIAVVDPKAKVIFDPTSL